MMIKFNFLKMCALYFSKGKNYFFKNRIWVCYLCPKSLSYLLEVMIFFSPKSTK